MGKSWRASVAALSAVVLVSLVCGATASRAQEGKKTRQGQRRASRTQPARTQTQPKLKLTPLKSSDSAKGSRVTITGTQSLGEYQSYRSGDRFYVLVPNADAGVVSSGVRGRGFDDAQVQKRGGDVVLSFRVQPGAKPSVKQKFNQLHVEFAAPEKPGDTDQPAQPTPTAAATPPSNTAAAGAQQTPQQQSDADARRAAERASQASAASRLPDASRPPVPDLPNQLPPAQSVAPQTTTAATTPAAGQPTEIAQARPPAQQGGSTATGTTIAPPGAQPGTSLGAALTRQWKPLAIAGALLAVGLGLFFAARRSSTRPRPPVEAKEVAAAKTAKLRDADAPAIASAVAPVAAPVMTTKKKKKRGKSGHVPTVAAEERIAETKEEEPLVAAWEEREEAVAEVEDTVPVAEEIEPTWSASDVELEDAATAASAVSATKEPVVAEEPTTTIERAIAFDADAIQSETRRLLEGETYDPAVLASSDRTTRQMIAAELLAALAARNPARKERARTAFVEHGFFNEAARDLRDAEAPAERASAARALGLVGDRLATPHLVAALEDTSVEVRRATVEALASVRDPRAVGPLESLIEREKSLKTKVPRKVVQRAVEACAEAPEELPPPSLAVATATAILATDAAHVEEPPAFEEALVTGEAQAIEAVGPEAPVAEASAEAPEIEEAAEAVGTIEEAPVTHAEEPAAEAEDTAITLAEEATPTFAEETTPTLHEEATPTVFEHTTATLTEESPATPVEVATPTQVEDETPTLAASEELTEVEEFAPVEETSIEVAPEPAAPVEAEPATAVEIETVAEAEPEPAALSEDWAETTTAIEVAPAVETEEIYESHLEAEIEATPVVPVEGLDARSIAERADEWVELDFGVAQSTPAQFETERGLAPSTAGEGADDDLNAHIVAEAQQESPAAGTPYTPAPVMSDAELVTDVTPFIPEALMAAEIEPAETTQAAEKSVAAYGEDDYSTVPKAIRERLGSEEPNERAIAIAEMSRLGHSEAFQGICAGFDDPSAEVRSAAARSLYEIQDDRAESFTRALREATPQRRRNIGAAIASSGLASEAIGNLTGESREKTYDAFSLLFLMAKAGEVQSLIRAVEGHPDNEVRLAVVKLLALSGQKDILPAFRRLAVRGSLPTEVRSAVMEAIYQVSSQESQKA